MSHTSEPWTVAEDLVIVTADWIVAIVSRHFGAASEDEANARLIAAAPDLLAACEAIQFELEARSLGAYFGIDAKHRIYAAIAKAKGEDQS